MANIPYADDADPAVAAVLEMARGKREAVGHMHRQMAHFPPLVEAFEAYSTMIRTRLPLDFELWGLVILRTVQVNEDAYQWKRCVQLGRKAGLADAKIIELWDWRNSTLYSPRQKAALAVVDEHCLERPSRRTAAADARSVLSDPEIVGICTVIGWFLLTFALIQPLALAADDPSEEPELVALDAKKHAN